MNKDVVYIEPEEDITDIIGKIEGAKSKIVALVPPKKAGVFKSIVNIKLIMKTGSNADKTVVLVTTDPAIIKLAAATKMPVTKDLKSAPAIPEPEEAEKLDDTEEVDVDDEAEEEAEEKKDEKEEEEKKEEEKKEDEKEGEKEDADKDEKSDDTEKEDKKEDDKNDDKEEKPKRDEKKDKKPAGKLASSNNPVLRWIGTHKKADIAIGVGLVLFIIVMVWAFAIAPAVTITLKLETVTGNFSESVSFTDKLTEENVSEGKFYIEQKKVDDKTEVEFEATGKKNVGEKATGNVVVYTSFENSGTFLVKAGTIFTHDGLRFISLDPATLGWDGKDISKCDNKNNAESLIKDRCIVSARVKVQAADAGANYNIAAAKTGWTTSSGVSVYSDAAMAGGTDKNITTVQQADIDKAIKDMTSGDDKSNIDTAKQKLLNEVEEDQFAIESSFKFEASDPVSTPKVGEEVKDGEKPKLTVNTTATMFVIDETKLEEFISEKAKLEKGFKIYEMMNPFVENFLKTDAGYVGKLKTSYIAGSTITENEVVDVAKGKGIGTAKRDLSDNFNGIKSIDVTTSVPWVTSVPGNPEKITVNIKADIDETKE